MKSRALSLFSGVIAVLAAAHALPVRYDQRQDGDWNVDARLQNFFVVLAPSNSAQLGSSGISLLDFASKAVPLRLRPAVAQAVAQVEDPDGQGRVPQAMPPKQREDVDSEEQQQVAKEAMGRSAGGFFMPRSALSVNAVPPVFTKDDIAKSPLAKLHPEMQEVSELKPVEEILIARSPVVALKYPAVPMLVAVPVPEVAPEAPAPPALLPLQPMQPMRPLDETAAPNPLAEQEEVLAVAVAPAPAAAAAPVEPLPQPQSEPVPSPQEPNAIQLDETNQVETDASKIIEVEAVAVSTPEEPASAPVQPPRLHLVGTGIEDCGPARQRNQEGICEDVQERD